MADYVGNVINAPSGVTPRTPTTDVELMHSTGAGFTQADIILEPGQGVLLPGTPLVQDGTTKRYRRAAYNATSVEGFLRVGTDTGQPGDGTPVRAGNLVRTGDVKYSVVVAANYGSALAGGAVSGLNGRLDTVRDSFIF